MSRHRFLFPVIVILLVGLGCSLPARVLSEPTSNPVTDLPVAVEEAPPAAPTDTLAPPPVAPTPTEAPPPEPEITESLPPFFPAAFMTTTGDGSVVTFYDLNGQPLGSAQTPGLRRGLENSLHAAGPFAGSLSDLPLIFRTFDNNGDLKQSLNNQITTLFPGPEVSYLQGVPGKYALVYATVNWGENLTSYLYARTTSGSGASWFWERSDPMGTALYPVAVEGDNDAVQAVFYTLRPWGIGGDIVFPPQAGLFKISLQNLSEELILTEDFTLIGLSPDHSVVAYTDQNNLVQDPHTRITLYDLTTTTMVPIDLSASSERGAGYAVFSPDNEYVAWMEGSGWSMAETPNFHSRVRIADRNGNILAELPDSMFASVAGDPTVNWVEPVGWLDGESLLVQVSGYRDISPLVKVRFDGSGMAYLASGSFLDFVYP